MRATGSIYLNGYGVPKNVVEARRWTERAAVAGDTDRIDPRPRVVR
jgi:TPR repeat protein